MIDPAAASRDAYSPHLRTALVVTGAGTAGAYQAGVLRAFHEAGVKIDVVGGHGIGAVTALFAAIDGAPRLWEPDGVWRGRRLGRLYRWRRGVTAIALAVTAALSVVLAPLALLAAGLMVYPASFLLGVAGRPEGQSLVTGYAALVTRAFDPQVLPELLPRALVLALTALVAVLAIVLAAAVIGARPRRTDRTPLWWRLAGHPLSATAAAQRFAGWLWKLVGGAAGARMPSDVAFGRAYAELLADNLGQPGFRELIVVVHDLDTRRDVVLALLSERYRREFLARRSETAERWAAETIDLAGVGRDHLIDGLRAALVLPVATAPHLVSFASESYWHGETHRLADRPGALDRLLEEVEAAGVEQVIVVGATAGRLGSHEIGPVRGDLRQRLAEYLSSFDAVAQLAVGRWRGRFKAFFEVRALENPLGPLDLRGRYDERADRRHTVAELVDRGYEDAYRQFIDPVVAAGAERLTGARSSR